MNDLAAKERELVALGAAIASNCVPCIEHHVPEAKKAGLTEAQIRQAVRLADRVKQVPAGKVLSVALGLLGEGEPAQAQARGSACCG